ncbi:MAG: LysE family translocator [Anaerolineae bacterium]
MDTQHLLLFVTAAAVLIATPGPNFIYVLTRGATQGRQAALLAVVGLCCGVIIHTTFAALGLSAILRTSALLFTIVKFVGGGYLIYLGIRAFLSGEAPTLGAPTAPPPSTAIVRQSIAASITNPKTALFFLTFLPQFVDPALGPVGPQMFFLGGLYMLLTLGIYGTVAYFSGTMGNWLLREQAMARRFRWLTASVFCALGVWALLPDRRA